MANKETDASKVVADREADRSPPPAARAVNVPASAVPEGNKVVGEPERKPKPKPEPEPEDSGCVKCALEYPKKCSSHACVLNRTFTEEEIWDQGLGWISE